MNPEFVWGNWIKEGREFQIVNTAILKE